MNYTLIAYRPDSEDYVRGCLMERYYGDCEIVYPDSEEELVSEVARFRDTELGCGEEGYQLTILRDGRPLDAAVCAHFMGKAAESQLKADPIKEETSTCVEEEQEHLAVALISPAQELSPEDEDRLVSFLQKRGYPNPDLKRSGN